MVIHNANIISCATPAHERNLCGLIKPLDCLPRKPPCNRRKTHLEEEEGYHSLKYIKESSQQHYSSLLSRKPIPSICFSCLSCGKGFVRMSATMSVVGMYTNRIRPC